MAAQLSEFEKLILHYLHEIATAQKETAETLGRLEKTMAHSADPDREEREARIKAMMKLAR